MKTEYSRIFSLAAAVCLLASVSVAAHHGFAAYDLTKAVVLKGTIVEVKLVTPHSRIIFDVKDAKKQVERWSIEWSNPVAMRRNGWNRETLKPGEEITVTGNIARNGARHMFPLRLIRLSDGKALVDRLGERASTNCVDGIRWDANGVGTKCLE